MRCQVHFDCPQLPPLTQPAKTVHELRPQDIKVVMALGDSITAGKINHRQSHIMCLKPYIKGHNIMISNVAINSPESYIISTGFGMMGSHRDIAEDLNEYRVE